MLEPIGAWPSGVMFFTGCWHICLLIRLKAVSRYRDERLMNHDENSLSCATTSCKNEYIATTAKSACRHRHNVKKKCRVLC